MFMFVLIRMLTRCFNSEVPSIPTWCQLSMKDSPNLQTFHVFPGKEYFCKVIFCVFVFILFCQHGFIKWSRTRTLLIGQPTQSHSIQCLRLRSLQNVSFKWYYVFVIETRHSTDQLLGLASDNSQQLLTRYIRSLRDANLAAARCCVIINIWVFKIYNNAMRTYLMVKRTMSNTVTRLTNNFLLLLLIIT